MLADRLTTAFPRYTRTFTADEYDDLGRAAWKLVGPKSVVFAGPWVLDRASPSERAAVLAEQSVLLRLVYRLALRPRYERAAAPLRPGSGWNVDQTRP